MCIFSIENRAVWKGTDLEVLTNLKLKILCSINTFMASSACTHFLLYKIAIFHWNLYVGNSILDRICYYILHYYATKKERKRQQRNVRNDNDLQVDSSNNKTLNVKAPILMIVYN